MQAFNRSILIVVLFLTSQASFGADEFKYVMCKNKQTVRTIRVEWNPKVQVCDTLYTKNGSDRSVGNGKFFGSCLKFLENVQTNLEKAGWNCRDISKTGISNSSQN